MEINNGQDIKVVKQTHLDRLRNLHQLSLNPDHPCYKENHNRYKHSRKAAKLMEGIINHFPKEKIRESVRYICINAILFHDIGHLPYCHKMENELNKNGMPIRHEEITLRIIDRLNFKYKKIMKNLVNGHHEIYSTDERYTAEEQFVFSLVSNVVVDVDRLQYLSMDIKFMRQRRILMSEGVQIIFDLENILNHIVYENGCYSFSDFFKENLMKARKLMYKNVYECLNTDITINKKDLPYYKVIINDLDVFSTFTDKDIEIINNQYCIKKDFILKNQHNFCNLNITT